MKRVMSGIAVVATGLVATAVLTTSANASGFFDTGKSFAMWVDCNSAGTQYPFHSCAPSGSRYELFAAYN
jgi:hypothetical protein